MNRTAFRHDSELSLAVRAAWLHYAGGLTQTDVAKKLGLTSLKAHRLIVRANQEGMVRIFIDGPVAECVGLEAKLQERYGLPFCEVVPDLDEPGLPLVALGHAGAQFLRREMARDVPMMIGVGHGRTLAACVDHLPRAEARHIKFVSLLGGLTRNFAASPYDVIHRLARRTGTEAYVMPVPFVANSAEDRDILRGQRGIAQIADIARGADLMLIGIGTADSAASLVETGMISIEELDAIVSLGGTGEILGHFFDSKGAPVFSGLETRIMSPGRDDLANRRVVAVAGGESKVCAIHAILRSGLLSGLITDERTAQALAGDNPPENGHPREETDV
jgi:DNA-binding transcriptional regulator LsrR (DeoR family)